MKTSAIAGMVLLSVACAAAADEVPARIQQIRVLLDAEISKPAGGQAREVISDLMAEIDRLILAGPKGDALIDLSVLRRDANAALWRLDQYFARDRVSPRADIDPRIWTYCTGISQSWSLIEACIRMEEDAKRRLGR